MLRFSSVLYVFIFGWSVPSLGLCLPVGISCVGFHPSVKKKILNVTAVSINRAVSGK